jgi:hypothetical protein
VLVSVEVRPRHLAAMERHAPREIGQRDKACRLIVSGRRSVAKQLQTLRGSQHNSFNLIKDDLIAGGSGCMRKAASGTRCRRILTSKPISTPI